MLLFDTSRMLMDSICVDNYNVVFVITATYSARAELALEISIFSLLLLLPHRAVFGTALK